MLICDPEKPRNGKPLLKIDFCDFSGLNKRNNFFTKLLETVYTVEINDKPDLLFFSDAGGSTLHKLYSCKKIFWSGESRTPNFEILDGAITPLELNNKRHIRMPYYVLGTECNGDDLIKRNDYSEKVLFAKRKDVSFVVSNAKRKVQHRNDFFRQLNKHIPVHSGGLALNNIGSPIGVGGRNKYEFLSKYKFNIAFENKQILGYTTEKIVEAMWAKAIPIYYGDPSINNDFNPKSFINVSDFNSTTDAIEHIMNVDNSDDLYRSYLEEPFFHNNILNKFFDQNRYLNFIQKILDSNQISLTTKKHRFIICKKMHL